MAEKYILSRSLYEFFRDFKIKKIYIARYLLFKKEYYFIKKIIYFLSLNHLSIFKFGNIGAERSRHFQRR